MKREKHLLRIADLTAEIIADQEELQKSEKAVEECQAARMKKKAANLKREEVKEYHRVLDNFQVGDVNDDDLPYSSLIERVTELMLKIE